VELHYAELGPFDPPSKGVTHTGFISIAALLAALLHSLWTYFFLALSDARESEVARQRWFNSGGLLFILIGYVLLIIGIVYFLTFIYYLLKIRFPYSTEWYTWKYGVHLVAQLGCWLSFLAVGIHFMYIGRFGTEPAPPPRRDDQDLGEQDVVALLSGLGLGNAGEALSGVIYSERITWLVALEIDAAGWRSLESSLTVIHSAKIVATLKNPRANKPVLDVSEVHGEHLVHVENPVEAGSL
jgi:hypothetical protein